MNRLKELRREIENIDREPIEGLTKRLKRVILEGRVKFERGIPILGLTIENQVFDRAELKVDQLLFQTLEGGIRDVSHI